MTGIIAPDRPAVKRTTVTWQDFTLEEHMRAHVGVPTSCIFQMKPIAGHTYRVNIIDPSRQDGSAFVKTGVWKVIETPEGYIFQEH